MSATGCTAGSYDLYRNVEKSINCAIAKEGSNVGPLGKSIILTELAEEPPISCMIDLVTGTGTISPEQQKAAYDAFINTTNIVPFDYTTFIEDTTNEQKELINAVAFYIFFPIFIALLVAIWLVVIFGWIVWPIGLFLSGLMFIILYGFSMFFRIQAYNIIINRNQIWQQNASNSQTSFKNGVAYLPQGLFAASCAAIGNESKKK